MKISLGSRLLAACAATAVLAWLGLRSDATSQDTPQRSLRAEGSSPHRNLQTVESCPAVGETAKIISEGTVELQAAAAGSLCLLVLTDDVKNFLPVARSYDENDWDRYIQTGKVSLGAEMDCTGSLCSVTLPAPYKPSLQYKLVAFEHTMEEKDEIARFLEQATFGPTRDDIASVMALTGSNTVAKMASWIQQQQDSSLTSPSSHREFFRKHANAQFERSSKYGHVTHPCQADVIYRKFALSFKHKGKKLQISTIHNDTKALSIDGLILTVIDGPALITTSPLGFTDEAMADLSTIHTEELTDGSYEICYAPMPGVGAPMKLYHPVHHCSFAAFGSISGNPPIEFPGASLEPSRIVNLDQATDLVPMDEAYFDTLGLPAQILRSPTALTGDACESVKMTAGYVPAVFGSYQNEWWVHDPRWQFRDNTVDQPMADGGGEVLNHTKGMEFWHTSRCANVERNFLNEDSCYMTTDLNACSHHDHHHQLLEPGEYGRGVVVCGSPGEVANDISLGGLTALGAFDFVTQKSDETSSFQDLLDQRIMVWTSLAIWGKDQLRQRVAWALYQILVVNQVISRNSQTEDWVNYYDIFVRNAFGTYKDVLKEVAFSRMMGEMLSFHYGKSQGFQWVRKSEAGTKVLELADENFAREIMQLFSVGLYEMNVDGTRKRDTDGNYIQTYSNDDIMEFARAWTGFWSSKRRGNSVAQNGNRLDPMTVVPKWRDQFPKMGLNGKYIGDGYPLCADLPIHDFLKKGAKYILLGYTPQAELGIKDPNRWASEEGQERFAAAEDGSLYDILCQPTNETDPTSCSFPPTVVLTENIDCTGDECLVDHIRTVNVREKVYYEYVRPACVHEAFFPEPKKIKMRSWSTYKNKYMCADPRTDVASAACCLEQGQSIYAMQNDTYWGERFKYSTAIERCQEMKTIDDDVDMCTSSGDMFIRRGFMPYHAKQFYWFGDVACDLKVKIDSVGKIAVVHDIPGEDYGGGMQNLMTNDDTMIFFRAQWSDKAQAISLFNNCDSTEGCSTTTDGYCLCNVLATESAAFNSTPTREQVLSDLTIGAFDPDVYDHDYTQTSADNVTIYELNGALSEESIFEVTDDFGVIQRRKNIIATATIAGSTLSFRVPVQFMSIAEPTKRDALYETDAVLDHLLYHENTAPFIAMHFAQRFGISNPTPTYVRAISEAFRSGQYNFSDGSSTMSFGKGKYGDLSATVAAVLLSREARSPLLEKDPAHGSMKETIIKVISVMRSLEFTTRPEFPFPRFYKSMQHRLGQLVYEAPDIFSYFNPTSQPDGLIGRSGLVSPETRIHTTPTIMTLANGLMNMVKYGMDRCYGGLGLTRNYHGIGECVYRKMGHFENSSGYLNFTPADVEPSAMVDELATIMTAGRLSSANRQTIVDAVANETNATLSSIKIRQLILTTAEFHTTGSIEKTEGTRSLPEPEEEESSNSSGTSSSSYKAVVYVMLKGGADTYNFIVPHTCPDNNLRSDYNQVRGEMKILNSERNLVINTIGQPCTHFAIHENLPILEELYNDGDLSWFMNAGVLNNGNVTKDNYNALTQTQLFAHNAMQQEVQQIDPFDSTPRTGILGRAVKALINTYGMFSSAVSINRPSYAVNGDVRDDESPLPLIMSEEGGQSAFARPPTETFDPTEYIQQLNGPNTLSSSLYSETYSELLVKSIYENDMLTNALRAQKLAPAGQAECGSDALNMVVKLMQTSSLRGVQRDLFFVEFGAWDFHDNQKRKMEDSTIELNEALTCFVDYVKQAGLWNQTSLVITSEFGRTMSPNSNQGTDHGWAGNYMVASGDLVGASIHGQYPEKLKEKDSDKVITRGRMIPTMSFESMFAPVYEWIGLQSSDFNDVLPNWQKAGSPLITKAAVYENTDKSVLEQTVTYGAKHFLRVKNLKFWLQHSWGERPYANDLTSRASNYLWIVRSNMGYGPRTSGDPLSGTCVKYGDKIYLQSNRQDYVWLSGGRSDDNSAVLTSNVVCEEETDHFYEWVIQSDSTITDEDTVDPLSANCVKFHESFFLRADMNSSSTERWLNGGGAWNNQSGFWTNVHTGDVTGGHPESNYYEWSFDAYDTSPLVPTTAVPPSQEFVCPTPAPTQAPDIDILYTFNRDMVNVSQRIILEEDDDEYPVPISGPYGNFAHDVDAGQLDITGDSVFVTLVPDFFAFVSSLTVELWVARGANRRWSRLFDFGQTEANGSGSNYWMLSAQSGDDVNQLTMEIRSGTSNSERFTINQGLEEDELYHVVSVFDGDTNTMSVYIDGVNVGSQTVSFGITDILDPAVTNYYLGKSCWNHDATFEGMFEEVHIYKTALNATDILDNFETGFVCNTNTSLYNSTLKSCVEP
mmetsp:Transcript_662/g.1594  ORF Transcript_662/g.1594 Transcript_662/m.1594 type:complete len:2342 (-) Transcript_662:143-7168(-)